MTKDEFEQWALSQIAKLDFSDHVYFGWSNWKSVAGMATRTYRRGEGTVYLITISEFYLDTFRDIESIKDTLLHELAHAMANYHNSIPMSSHGREWKFYATVLGAKPQRCFHANNKNLDLSKFKYTAYCPNPDCDTSYGFSRMGKLWRYNLENDPTDGYECALCNLHMHVRKNF